MNKISNNRSLPCDGNEMIFYQSFLTIELGRVFTDLY